MDQIFLSIVVGASVILVVAIWIKLRLDNEKLEKIISKHNQDVTILENNRIRKSGNRSSAA